MGAQDAIERAERGVDETRRRAQTGTGWYAWAARAGLVAAGMSYALVGVLAIGVVVDAGGGTTSREGALRAVARQPLGEVALALLAAGFAAYALWRLVQAFAEREDPADDEAVGPAKTWAKRAGYVGKSVVYGALAFGAVRLLAGAHGETQTREARRTTATVLDGPAGRWIVLAVGVAVVGAGAWNVYRGLTARFEKRWRTGPTGKPPGWATPIGVVGHVARGVVFALAGAFLIEAAREYDPSEAVGLDGALQKLAQASHGPWLLGATAIGLVAYGAYCLVDARYRDVSAGPRAGRATEGN